ncbi:hypothetical protein [Arhodomonas sp. SL1]|uniref:hypothetical protein n=1 Tax=Arhodomonas sp. SL1 TaxID=3425691 RepID=UPI003F881CDD
MHSRFRLHADDFTVAAGGGAGAPDIAALTSQWRAEDRVAFVCPDSATGIAGTGSAILLLTHWFYRREVAKQPGFFDYPRHYAIVGEVGARSGPLGPQTYRPWSAAWCRLDVWPATHHLVAEPTPEALMLAVLTVEPQWLFWPARLPAPGPMSIAGGGDDSVVRGLLRARLRGVVLYGDATATMTVGDRWSVECTGGAATLLAESEDTLPQARSRGAASGMRGQFRTVSVTWLLGNA